MTETSETSTEPSAETSAGPRRRPGAKQLAAESFIGLAIAALLTWVAIAAVTEVPFVYQGL